MAVADKTPSSLRQRRSRSPAPGHKHKPNREEYESLVEKGSFSKPYELEANNHGEKTTTTRTEQKRSIVTRAAMLFCLASLTLLLFWLALLTGFYNPDANSCEIPIFDYPDCSNALMHVGEVAPPLTSAEWLQLRELYHQAMIKAGNGAPFSLAEDWNESNTVGFQDVSLLDFKIVAGRGRAVFSKQPISQGTKIWDSRYRAVFPNSCVAKHFFAQQTNQQKCDAMFWGYVNNFYGNGIQYMFDLDGHGYINHNDEEPNAIHHFEGELDKDRYCLSRLLRIPFLGIIPLSHKDWERRNRPGAYGLYAARDIQVGEEITYNYDEIYMFGWLDWFTIFLERSLPISEWFTL